MSTPPLYRPDPKFRDPFTVDTLVGIFDKVPFSPPFLVILPTLLAGYYQKTTGKSILEAGQTPVAVVKTLWDAFADHKYRWPVTLTAGILWFIVTKTISKAMSRLVLNNGVYSADKPDWSKDVAVVTGGAAGIGKEVAVLLAERSKKKVAVIDLGAMTYSHPNVSYYKADVSNRQQMEEVAAKIRSEIGEPSYVINNAGIAVGKTILNLPFEVLLKVMNVNTYAHVHSAQIFLPYMVKNNHGHVVTVASSASYMALPQISAYAMSKAAVLAFHEVLTGELRARYNAPKVRTTVCCPTKVDTQLGAGLKDAPSQFFTPTLRPETVGRRIVNAIDSGLSEHLMLPGYTVILPAMRGVPAYVKRFVELRGNTDYSVTDESEAESQKKGYIDHSAKGNY